LEFYSVPFIDFIYCICAPKWPSSRETIADLSTTRTLEVLMVGIYVNLLKMEKPHTLSYNPQSTEQTIFRALHAVVDIISIAPSRTSTSFVHTSTHTRDPAFLAFAREKMHGESARILRYYAGECDKQDESYTLQLTRSTIVLEESFELIRHHVTVINLPTLAVKVKVSALPTLVAITERLMQLVM